MRTTHELQMMQMNEHYLQVSVETVSECAFAGVSERAGAGERGIIHISNTNILQQQPAYHLQISLSANDVLGCYRRPTDGASTRF